MSWMKYFSWVMYSVESTSIVQWEGVQNISKPVQFISIHLKSASTHFSVRRTEPNDLPAKWDGRFNKVQFFRQPFDQKYLEHGGYVFSVARFGVHLFVFKNQKIIEINQPKQCFIHKNVLLLQFPHFRTHNIRERLL